METHSHLKRGSGDKAALVRAMTPKEALGVIDSAMSHAAHA